MFPQSDAMEVRMRASKAVAAQQAQQGREIAARFSEQSAKNQHDSRRDHHFEQRLMLQVRCSSSPAPQGECSLFPGCCHPCVATGGALWVLAAVALGITTGGNGACNGACILGMTAV
jgi:hypothetical protein